MSNYKLHAEREFRAAGWLDADGKYCDEMQEAICNNVLKLLEVFSDEGHSGSSAPYAIGLFSELAKFKPLKPLTGEDWEWLAVGEGMYQNIRCGTVFKQPDRFSGQPYDINGKVFWEWYADDGGEVSKDSYTNGESAVPIEFPYKQKTEYVFVPTPEYPNESFTLEKIK